MRHIGTSAEKTQAERCVHCLDAQQSEATWRPLQETGYAVWVLDEERVTTARQRIARGLSMLHNGFLRPLYAGATLLKKRSRFSRSIL